MRKTERLRRPGIARSPTRCIIAPAGHKEFWKGDETQSDRTRALRGKWPRGRAAPVKHHRQSLWYLISQFPRRKKSESQTL
jgi:hypothetical protein